MSRSVNSIKNILVGLGGRLFLHLTHFIIRTVFLYTLGVEYLGLQGLFLNILGMLALSELGMSTAVSYVLYKPLAENNTQKICQIMHFIKNAYRIVALFILVGGMCILPFVSGIAAESKNLGNVNVIFLLYLFKTVVTYLFFAYKSVIIVADQKRYLFTIYTTIISVVVYIVQFITLVVLCDVIGASSAFVLYLIVGIIGQLISNIIISCKADKMYPYLKDNRKAILPRTERKELLKKIFATACYKINSKIVKSTDSIVITGFLGIVANGLYSNYYFITSNVFNIVRIFFSSMTASIGNLVANESVEKSEFVFRSLSLISYWIFGFCSVCMFVLIEPFILLWAGQNCSLGQITAWIFALEFLMEGYQLVSISYKDACGLFWEGRFSPIVTATLNIIISIILVKKCGVAGVILGTTISRFLTTWWFEPVLVYKKAFHMPVAGYFMRYILAVLLVLANVVIIKYIGSLYTGNMLISFVLNTLLCVVITNLTFFAVYRNMEEFSYVRDIVTGLLAKRIKR